MSFFELVDSIDEIQDKYDVLLFDVWGVIIEGKTIYKHVVEKINKLSSTKKVYFITNAPRTISFIHDRLKEFGIVTSESNIFTSGNLALTMLLNSEKYLQKINPKVFHLKSKIGNNLLEDVKVDVTENPAEADVLLLTTFLEEKDTTNQYDEILQLCVSNKTTCLCANPDLFAPELDSYKYCAGYFAEIYKQKGGKVVYTGKPYPELYYEVLKAIPEVSKDRILMIGDTIETDVLGANGVGIDCALVITGNSAKLVEKNESSSKKFLKIEDKVKQLKCKLPYILTEF